MEEMAGLPDDFRARIILAANDYAYFGKMPADPIIAYAMRHIIAFIDRRNAAEAQRCKRHNVEMTQQNTKPKAPQVDTDSATDCVDACTPAVEAIELPALSTDNKPAKKVPNKSPQKRHSNNAKRVISFRDFKHPKPK